MAPVVFSDRPSLNDQFQALEDEDKLSDLPGLLRNGIPEPKTATNGPQADIDWVPSYEKYQQRVKRHMKSAASRAILREGFPSLVKYRMCWNASDIQESEYVEQLSDTDIKEIEAGVKYFKDLKLSKDDISRDTFPLPTLGPRLLQQSVEVLQGRGFTILRGLDPTKYNLADNVILYAGIASYIGNKRGVQDDSGNVLVHITDVGAQVAPDNERQSPYANNAQPFHNDLGDIIAMYVMDRAASGGRSKIASTAYVYNEIASTRPDIINTLADNDWAFDKHTEKPSYYTRPILFHDDTADRVLFCFSRRQLTGSAVSPRPASLPPLTEAQAEALDAVHFTAARAALHIRLERGDLQFVNNLGVFHSREAFTDESDNHKRHLIRMWLRNEDMAWPTPEGLREVWNEIYGPDKVRVWYMNATHGHAHVINRKASCHG